MEILLVGIVLALAAFLFIKFVLKTAKLPASAKQCFQ